MFQIFALYDIKHNVIETTAFCAYQTQGHFIVCFPCKLLAYVLCLVYHVYDISANCLQIARAIIL